MSGEGRLRELERMLDGALRRWKQYGDSGSPAAAYRHGIAVGMSVTISVISRCSPEYEFNEGLRRIGETP